MKTVLKDTLIRKTKHNNSVGVEPVNVSMDLCSKNPLVHIVYMLGKILQLTKSNIRCSSLICIFHVLVITCCFILSTVNTFLQY